MYEYDINFIRLLEQLLTPITIAIVPFNFINSIGYHPLPNPRTFIKLRTRCIIENASVRLIRCPIIVRFDRGTRRCHEKVIDSRRGDGTGGDLIETYPVLGRTDCR